MTPDEIRRIFREVIREEIPNLADAVVARIRQQEELQLDAAFEASLPVAEQKRRAREEMRRQDRVRKAQEVSP